MFKRKKKNQNEEEELKSTIKGPLIKRHKPLRYNVGYKQDKDIKKEIEKRYNILTIIVTILVIILISGLFVIQVVKKEYYTSEVEKLTQTVVEGGSAPRGRIYDRNGNVLVDNKAVKVIYYKKPSGVTTKQEMSVAYKLVNMIDLDYSSLSEYDFKNFWILNHSKKAKEKITDGEWDLLEKRKIDANDIQKYKIERVTEEDLAIYGENDKKAAYIYALMNTGYSYAEKVIKDTNVTDEEYALVAENLSNLPGVDVKLDWERVYPYGDTFKTMFGSVSTSKKGIPSELKDKYLKEGYSLNDRVGTSYLEYRYESTLKGTKNKYLVNNDGSYQLLKEGKRGTDIVISIDINLQQALEQILTEQVLYTKKYEANTNYYNRSFVIISNPQTGEILAMAGKQVKEENGEYTVVDYTPGIMTSPVVMGSVVKGASQIVGYNTGALKIGESRLDQCVKIAATKEKCSWRSLGMLNDITALAYSSNTYQYYTAIKVGNGNYVYNKPLTVDDKAFDTYRNTFAQFGLGVKTGIDLPTESLGYKGNSTGAGYLLDFSIGQYDTYTPIQLSQYINTIANGGSRLEPMLYVGKYDGDSEAKIKDKREKNVLNTVETDSKYMDRVHQGFEAVLSYGTGAGYINAEYKPAGKTGTSESFVDTDNDGKIDTATISTTFVAYAPYDNPSVSFAIVSPDVSIPNGTSSYQSSINKRLAQAISKKYFEIYK